MLAELTYAGGTVIHNLEDYKKQLQNVLGQEPYLKTSNTKKQ
jgi:CTP-dependent riboflavin kinase